MEFINPGASLTSGLEAYPTKLTHSQGIGFYTLPATSTVYGMVLAGHIQDPWTQVRAGQWFCLTSVSEQELRITQSYDCHVVYIERMGFRGQRSQGGPLESQGRLVYIDGCSDSLLAYPPRQGDASLNHLHFPRGILQSFHTHPSSRFGIVVEGSGWADYHTADGEVSEPLMQGRVFYLPAMMMHRFRTDNSSMTIVAYHPDGDWGPTDHNHTMLNRTYLK